MIWPATSTTTRVPTAKFALGIVWKEGKDKRTFGPIGYFVFLKDINEALRSWKN